MRRRRRSPRFPRLLPPRQSGNSFSRGCDRWSALSRGKKSTDRKRLRKCAGMSARLGSLGIISRAETAPICCLSARQEQEKRQSRRLSETRSWVRTGRERTFTNGTLRTCGESTLSGNGLSRSGGPYRSAGGGGGGGLVGGE